MSYLERLKNKNMNTIGTAKTVKSIIAPLFAVNAVSTLSIFEKIKPPFCSFCSDHPKHISKNEISVQEVKAQEPAPIIEDLHPCPLCAGVLFNEGSRGGYFCVECQTLMEGATVVRVVRGITPREARKTYIHHDPTLPPTKNKKRKPSPIALAWLLEHRQVLDKAGWTRAELYRRNKYKRGIAWMDLWDKAFLLAYLHENGVIEFECSIHGRDYIQTARPASMLTMHGADPSMPYNTLCAGRCDKTEGDT